MEPTNPQRLEDFPVHLGPGSAARELPRFEGTPAWYQAYEASTEGDPDGGWLVSWHHFDASWEAWEMHPLGHEVVLCVAGQLELIQEVDGTEVSTTLSAGERVLNLPGIWHTANLAAGQTATCVFVTAGRATQGRPR